MDARGAIDELVELSSQVREAAILDAQDAVLAATAGGERLAGAARALLEHAGGLRASGEIERVEVALPEGSVYVVRRGAHAVVATTVAEPASGLVVYDLRTCLERLEATDGA